MSEKIKSFEHGQTLVTYEERELEAIAATYPEEMREPFLWLANYAANECSRNLNALEHKIKTLGLPTTSGTLSKILRGRWNRNSRCEPCSPIMSQSGFLDLVEKLRGSPELGEMVETLEFIETPTAKRIMEYIDKRRSPTRINKWGLIVGPTGVGKTATFKHFTSLPANNRSCKWMESPHKPKMSYFITKLGSCYNVPLLMSTTRKMARIIGNVTNKKCVIIDNIQRMWVDQNVNDVAGSGQEIFNYLQQLQDETGFTPILSATPEFYDEFLRRLSKGYFEQFEGRIGGRDQFLILPAYTPDEDIIVIATKYGLASAKSHLPYLRKIARTPGRVRILFEALQTAKEEAVDSKVPLTIDLIKENLPESTVDRILKEAA